MHKKPTPPTESYPVQSIKFQGLETLHISSILILLFYYAIISSTLHSTFQYLIFFLFIYFSWCVSPSCLCWPAPFLHPTDQCSVRFSLSDKVLTSVSLRFGSQVLSCSFVWNIFFCFFVLLDSVGFYALDKAARLKGVASCRR